MKRGGSDKCKYNEDVKDKKDQSQHDTTDDEEIIEEKGIKKVKQH